MTSGTDVSELESRVQWLEHTATSHETTIDRLERMVADREWVSPTRIPDGAIAERHLSVDVREKLNAGGRA